MNLNLYEELQKDYRFKEGLHTCINCGTCTAICPAAEFYKYDPRKILDTVQRKDNDAIEALLSPLKIFRVPVGEFAMMMSIALRFIPTLTEETAKIMNAQKARGADFETGGLIKRAKALIPILVPLFVSAFRRADELAMAMESRAYTGGEGRTRLKPLKARPSDILILIGSILYFAGCAALGILGF